MKYPLGVILVITSFVDFKTRITKLSKTSCRIRKDLQNSPLTHSNEIVDFYKAVCLYDHKRNDSRFLAGVFEMLQYSVSVAPRLRLELTNYDSRGQKILLEILMERGKHLKESKISLKFRD